MKQWVYKLDQIDREGAFGGKAIGLLEATRLAIPLPPTWVVDSELFSLFLSENPHLTSDGFAPLVTPFLSHHLPLLSASSLKGVMLFALQRRSRTQIARATQVFLRASYTLSVQI